MANKTAVDRALDHLKGYACEFFQQIHATGSPSAEIDKRIQSSWLEIESRVRRGDADLRRRKGILLERLGAPDSIWPMTRQIVAEYYIDFIVHDARCQHFKPKPGRTADRKKQQSDAAILRSARMRIRKIHDEALARLSPGGKRLAKSTRLTNAECSMIECRQCPDARLSWGGMIASCGKGLDTGDFFVAVHLGWLHAIEDQCLEGKRAQRPTPVELFAADLFLAWSLLRERAGVNVGRSRKGKEKFVVEALSALGLPHDPKILTAARQIHAIPKRNIPKGPPKPGPK